MTKNACSEPEVVNIPTPNDRKLYFDNNRVEDLMLRYRWTGCTDPDLRDKIMENTEELIRQIIRAHNLHRIYPGQEDSAFMDLFQTAWVQIERTLYKYRARVHCADCFNYVRPMDSCIYSPGDVEYDIIKPRQIADMELRCPQCMRVPERIVYRGTSKIFNMWSQVARTVILAYIKKENRDHKNSDAYKTHLDSKNPKKDDTFHRFIKEARQICKYNRTYYKIIDALEHISKTDDRPYEGLVNKLIRLSGQPRSQVTNFLKLVRSRRTEFTDSPDNDRQPNTKIRSVSYEEDW